MGAAGKPIEKQDAFDVANIHEMVTNGTWVRGAALRGGGGRSAGAQAAIMEYENMYSETCGSPALARFEGRDGDYSIKARVMNLFGVNLPFDRHDWTVDRCGKEQRYIIDYYRYGDTYSIDARCAAPPEPLARRRLSPPQPHRGRGLVRPRAARRPQDCGRGEPVVTGCSRRLELPPVQPAASTASSRPAGVGACATASTACPAASIAAAVVAPMAASRTRPLCAAASSDSTASAPEGENSTTHTAPCAAATARAAASGAATVPYPITRRSGTPAPASASGSSSRARSPHTNSSGRSLPPSAAMSRASSAADPHPRPLGNTPSAAAAASFVAAPSAYLPGELSAAASPAHWGRTA